jgi:hypothetical protein
VQSPDAPPASVGELYAAPARAPALRPNGSFAEQRRDDIGEELPTEHYSLALTVSASAIGITEPLTLRALRSPGNLRSPHTPVPQTPRAV